MMKKILFSPLLGLGLLLSPLTAGAETIPPQQAWQHLFEADLPGGGLLFHTYGETEPLVLEHLGTEENGVSRYRSRSGAEITLRTSRAAEGYGQVEVSVTQNGKEPLLLEPELVCRFPRGDQHWFDGFAEQSQPQGRDEICGTLPFVALYDGKHGTALGLNPNDLASDFRSRLSEEEGSYRLSFSSRMVIAPGKTETRRFILFSFTPDYGYLNAIGEYQRFFPAVFEATPGIHPETHGPLLGGLAWRTQNDRYLGKDPKYNQKISDVIRWMGGGWEWCYAGFGYRPGDWLCTEEETGNWQMPEKGKRIAFTERFNMTAAEYLRQHQEAFERIEPFGIASMMYIIPNYCEEELARERYPDSIYYDDQNKPRSAGPPWVVQHDRSLQMYPYGNSFGDYTLEAIKTIVTRSDIAGFAFDCIDRARYPYHGPGVERSPGQAYDDKGRIFVNSEIAHAKFGEAVHDLHRDGLTMALTGNFRGDTGSYLAARVLDAILIEHSPWDERPLAQNVRYLMGRKSITWLRGFERLPQITERKGEALVEMMDTLTSYTILQGLRLGIYPNFRYVTGNPRLIHYMQVFNDLFRHYQWNPVPGATAPGELWLTRYGYGADGVLAVGNPTAAAVKGELQPASRYFGAATTAWIDYEGRQSLTNRMTGADPTIGFELPRGKALLLAAGLSSQTPFRGEITAQRTRQPDRSHTDRWSFTSPARQAWSVRDVPGYRVGEITLNGKPLEAEVAGSEHRFQVGEGEQVVTVRYLPEIALPDTGALANLPFLNEKKEAGFAVEIPADTAIYRHQAQKLVSFFSNYVLGMADPDKVLPVPVVVRGEAPPEAAVQVVLRENPGAKRTEITVNGSTVTVTGSSPNHLAKGLNALLDVLQDVYPHYGLLQVHEKSSPADHRALEPSLFQQNTDQTYLPWKQP
ncbi:MAG TPA: hypothetical protein VNQ90_02330 [Chthoniobacteraceae bacterium]|nr:hypothetical protein [Chthoniobacteraceae bacterium]